MSSGKVQATRAQIAGAREYLGLTKEELAKIAGVARTTVLAFEKGTRPTRDETRERLQVVLEARGIVFTNGNKPGFYFDREQVIIPTA